jgi:outer membrane protein assembly factor BamB
MSYTPVEVGNYSITVNFVGFRYLWNSTYGGGVNDYYGTLFPSTNKTNTLVVQQDPVSMNGLPNIPALPTDYWTRPIEGQNSNWYLVSSNWFNNAHDFSQQAGSQNNYQPDGTAPNSPHILWTRPTEDNGILGGTYQGRQDVGNAYNAGSQYQPRFGFKVIMYGRLYYSPNIYYSGASELLDCVDLKTGELLWETNTTGVGMPSFGYDYSQDNMNQHGIVNPGWLFTNNFARSYQPARGFATTMNITDVPSGFEIMGPSGELLRYVFTNKGSTANPNYYLGQWNSSTVVPASNPSSGFINASTATRYDWNVSSPIQFSTAPTVRAADLTTNILWGSNGSWPTGTGAPSYTYPDSVTVWAISIDPKDPGKLISMKNISTQMSDGQNIIIERADALRGIFVAIQIPSCRYNGYDMKTGNLLWTTESETELNPYGYFTWSSLIQTGQTKMAYGLLYTGGYVGSVSAYYDTNGSLAWRQTYPSGGEKINNYATMIGLIADGKIYVGTHEHSADTPLYRGNHVRCLNATTGEKIWEMSGWMYPYAVAEADGVLIYWNNYDGQVYAVGQGPTSMTVTAPNIGVTTSTPIMIRGTVMDVSAGTTQQEQSKNFPNGVPAVSDESQAEWMEYVYMQKAKPENTTGVPVSIDVIDSNGNQRNIGSTTSDSSGMFSFNWTPDISGSYTVIATFTGSNSYWPSSAETSFYAAAAPAPTASPIPVAAQPPTEIYFAISTAAIIITIVIIGALVVLMLRRRP